MAGLEETAAAIRIRPIPWDGYVRANLVAQADAAPFKALENLGPAQRAETIGPRADAYAELVVRLLGETNRDDLVKYWILFISEPSPELADALVRQPKVWDVLGQLLGRNNDEPINLLVLKASTVLAARQIAPREFVVRLISSVASKLGSDSVGVNGTNSSNGSHGNGSNGTNTNDTSATNNGPSDTSVTTTGPASPGAAEVGVQILADLLQTREYRLVWWDTAPNILPALLNLAAGGVLQVQYSALLCLWLASFVPSIAVEMVPTSVSVLLDVGRTSIKDKIVRLAVASLSNMARFVPKHAIPVIIAEHGLEVLAALCERKFADEELKEDAIQLRDTLQSAYDSMTTFEEYQAELSAHKLRWSPPHKSHVFWRSYIDEFRKHDWAALRKLLELLNSEEHTTQAIAAHDVAAIIEVAPEAVPIISTAGGKLQLMEMMSSSDAEVRFEALRATQEILGHLFN